MGLLLLILYNLLAPLIAAFYFLFFFFSPRRGLLNNLLAELKERLAVSVPVFAERPLWFHAASVGEVRALKALLPLVRERCPSKPVLITTSTSSGKAEALKLTPAAVLLPLDFYPLMRRFISGTRPELIMIAETELWPNLLYAAGKEKVKVLLINARISARTLGFYRLFPPLARLMFSGIVKISAQSRGDFERYGLLPGVKDKLVLTGNIKYDLATPVPEGRAEIEAFFETSGWKEKKIFCAGSTHPEEEDLILDAFLKIKAACPDARLIIAPRHPETAASTADRIRNKGLIAPLWSRRGYARPDPDCLLVDETGRLADIYSFSDVVFVGGTLDDTGGHNVLEPSAFSKPVLFGPNVKHTREGAEALISKNGGFMIRTSEELADKAISLLKDPSALSEAGAASKAALESLQGATNKTLSIIETYINPASATFPKIETLSTKAS